MTDDLKPCPCCGGKAERIELQDKENFDGHVIECQKCGLSTRIYFGEKDGLEESWQCRNGYTPDSIEYVLWDLVTRIESAPHIFERMTGDVWKAFQKAKEVLKDE